MRNAVMAALYNVLTAASPGINWYDTSAKPGTSTPFGVFSVISVDVSDTASTESDEIICETRVIDDGKGGLNGPRTAASYANKARAALTGQDALNKTGSLSGYTCTGLYREDYDDYLDGSGFWHSRYRFRIRVS